MSRALAILPLVLAVSTGALAEDGEARAFRLMRDHRLLTAKQLSCVFLMRREQSSARTLVIGVYEKHDRRCGGDPDVTHRLFDLELDLRSGRARWDRDDAFEMTPIPRRRRHPA